MPVSAGQRLFGTDGIRGVAGQFPLDDRTAAIIGRALVLNLADALGRSPRIVIGRDTRESGPQIELAIASGKAREMLDSLQKDGSGDFHKLAREHEWVQLQQALKNKDPRVLNARMGM